MSATHAHDWVHTRLRGFSIGILSEDETLAIEEHVRDCVECRSRLASLRPVAAADVGHLPASLVATWPRSVRALVGLERELVAAHLDRCAACRASLEFVGHAPELPHEQPERGVRSVRANRVRTVWLWALGLSGAAAGVVAWMLAAQPGSLPGGSRDAGTSATMGGARPQVETAVTFELAVDSLAAGAVMLPEPGFRGSPVRVLDLGAVTSVSGVVFIVPPALRPPSPEDGARVLSLTLLRDGRELATRQIRFYALGDAFRMRPAGRLEAGEYDLRFALAPAASSERPLLWFYRLRVR